MDPAVVYSHAIKRGVLFLDLRKAFDTVHHSILLDKLKHLGLSDNTVLWFKSYLNERLQVTKINDQISKEAKVTFGVPQGSILGPLLFSLYVNDLPGIIQDRFISLYADDTDICLSDSDPVQLQHKLELKLALVQQWYRRNKLSLNLSKTSIMIFGTNNQLQIMKDVTLKVGSTEILKVDNYKYLGMKLDARLTFSDHISYIKGKTLSKIKLLGRLNHTLDSDLLLMLYEVLILPIIDYGDIVYHKLTQNDAIALQRLQNVACCAILKADSYTHIADMHEDLNLSMLYQRRCQHICTLMHKLLNGIGPSNCADGFMYEHTYKESNL